MQVLESEYDSREIEPCDVRCKPLSASEVCEELSSGDVGQQHVDVEPILEGGIEIDDERMPNTRHDVTFRINVFHLSKSDDL